jgi:hypothetical protein
MTVPTFRLMTALTGMAESAESRLLFRWAGAGVIDRKKSIVVRNTVLRVQQVCEIYCKTIALRGSFREKPH